MLRTFRIEITFFVVTINRAGDDMDVAFTLILCRFLLFLFPVRRGRTVRVRRLLRLVFLLLFSRLLCEIVRIRGSCEDD